MSARTSPSAEHSIRTLIADRNRMASQLLAECLAQDPRFKVAVATTTAEIISMCGTFRPDVVVISADLESMPRKGLHAARRVSATDPHVNIVILVEITGDEIISSFRNGARGVFCRSEPLSELKECVLAVSQGRIWVHNGGADYLLGAIKSAPSCDAISQVSTLSKREIEVAELAAQGLTNKQIAAHLALSEHTVKNYLFRVFEKLKISNRIELLFLMVNERKANRNGDYPRTEIDGVDSKMSIEKYIQAAQDGFVPAQFILALAHLEGYGAEKNQESAYFWLRVTENHCSEILRLSHTLLEELKGQIRIPKVEALERALNTTLQDNESVLSKKPTDLVRANKTLLSRLAG
jgi:two-component system nitrate/nitrite response regulator NarL